jgi:hypothetical protein
MSRLDRRSLDEIVRSITAQAIDETLGPIRGERRLRREGEADLQAAKARQLQGVEEADSPEDLEEVDEDEASKDQEAKPAARTVAKPTAPEEKGQKTVSKKIATGKEEPKPEALIPDARDIKDVTFDQVINMVNMMRSGRSTKNPDTKQSLKDYFKGLNAGERQALFVLLSGITQILAGGVEGTEAPDPSEVGIRINPKAPTDKVRPDSRPERPAAPAKAPGTQGAQDKDLPIVVGEAADRTHERRILARIGRPG